MSMSQSGARRWTIHSGQWVGEGRDRYYHLPHVKPSPGDAGEEIEVVALDAVLQALEDGYHPQNPSAEHPADYLRRRFDV